MTDPNDISFLKLFIRKNDLVYRMSRNRKIESPCVKFCEVDKSTQLCKGCLRNIDEITTFPFLDDNSKILLNETLAKRRKYLLNLKKENPDMLKWLN